MAADDNKLIVSIELDDGSVKQGLARVEQETAGTFQRIGETAAGVFAGQALLSAFQTIKNTVSGLFSEAVQSANEAGQAVQLLNSTLALSGRFSDTASKQFTDLADKIQATTTVSDDTVLSVERLASTYAKTNAQALKLTQATVDFAAVTGQDANSAAIQLSATLSGQAGRLARLFPELKTFTKAQLEAGAAIDFFATRFAGAAEAQANTFGGRIIQLGNAFDDFLKSIGKLVTESPTVVNSIKFLADEFLRLAEAVNTRFSGTDQFSGLSAAVIALGRTFIAVTRPIEYTFEVVGSGVQLLLTGVKVINTVVSAVGDTVLAVGRTLLNFYETVFTLIAGSREEINALQKDLSGNILKGIDFSQTKAAFNGMAETANNAYNAVNGFGKLTLSTTLSDSLDRYAKALDQVKAKTQQFQNAVRTPGPLISDLSGQVDSLTESVALLDLGFHDAAFNIVADSVKLFQEQGAAAFKSFANSVASGFSAIGRTLVKGGDVFKAFAGAVLSGIGAAAIQMGSFYILAGLARLLFSFGSDGTAYGLIAVGGALATLGGALSAFGDGVTGTSNPSTSVATGGGSAISTDTSQTINPETDVAAPDAGPRVQVNIQGDVFDSRDTGLRIVDIINQEFNASGARILAT